MLLLFAAALLSSGASAWDFEVVTELPSSYATPSDKEYVAVMAADEATLPSGTTQLKLVILDAGCGGAVPLPIPWAPVPSNQRLLFAPVNYSSDWNQFGTADATPPGGCGPALHGLVRVAAEAWSGRVGAFDERNGTAGRRLGTSAPLDVHWDYGISAARFDRFRVTATGPGEGDIEFFPAAADAGTVARALRMGGYYFVRTWPLPPAPAPEGQRTGQRTGQGMPLFSAANFDGQQDQMASSKFRVAWTQPGTYYIGLNGAWAGQTCHNVVQSPMDGVHTASYPQVNGTFQPVAIVVPFENGTTIATPPGFAGPTFTLPSIAGDRRVALSKRNLTIFDGASWYVPTMMPITSAASQCGLGCVAAPPAAVDFELPLGITLDNASGAIVPLPPPPLAGSARAATHHRCRALCSAIGGGCSMSMQAGVRVAPALAGQTLSVGFRALDAPHLAAHDDVDSWIRVSALVAPRPNTTLPASSQLVTSLTYGLTLAKWPADEATGLSPLGTYRGLGLNTVSDSTWADPANRTGWEARGLRYGPVGGCPFSIPAMSVAAAKAANITALCGDDAPVAPADIAAERAALVAAAEFSASPGAGSDIGYDGCLRRKQLSALSAHIGATQPAIQFYDWEVRGVTKSPHFGARVLASPNVTHLVSHLPLRRAPPRAGATWSTGLAPSHSPRTRSGSARTVSRRLPWRSAWRVRGSTLWWARRRRRRPRPRARSSVGGRRTTRAAARARSWAFSIGGACAPTACCPTLAGMAARRTCACSPRKSRERRRRSARAGSCCQRLCRWVPLRSPVRGAAALLRFGACVLASPPRNSPCLPPRAPPIRRPAVLCRALRRARAVLRQRRDGLRVV